MQDLPHKYLVTATAGTEGHVTVESPSLPAFESSPPPEFGGPEGYWSPETILTAAVADCIILTFRAIARASRYEWIELSCDVEGELDKIDRSLQFIGFHINAVLGVPPGADVERGQRLLEKAEQGCLITKSLKADTDFIAKVEVVG